jgi:hypothetical protein
MLVSPWKTPLPKFGYERIGFEKVEYSDPSVVFFTDKPKLTGIIAVMEQPS